MKNKLIGLILDFIIGHRFDMKEVIDLSSEPKCVFCNKSLAELTKTNK